ncbi:MAG: aminotransferase class III-fold pyridoxal phosphate-dependent enzyme [Gammaproteobacteria bacterium]|nr:aminotransferase class III-fold pyridoxal phosphate-dependent enzyme [Gammaproteobacteria bacterium]
MKEPVNGSEDKKMRELNWPFLPGRNIEIERGEGVHLITRQGQSILDAAGGAVVCNIGHGRQRVADKVAEATLDYSYVVPPWITPSRRALVEVLERHWLPNDLRRIHITSGGSEAVDAAMKMALQYHYAKQALSRTKIISRDISYHGTTMATIGASGHPARRRGLEHALGYYPRIPTPYPLRCPLGPHHAGTAAYYAQCLRETIEAEGPETIAAFLAEPITGSSGGAIVPPEDYWRHVRAICDEYGVLLILDEVMTGFGRTGTPFAFQHWDITPDILVAGKGLAGGYAPLGGVFASENVGTAIGSAGMNVMFNTFGAHPAACAAGAEVLTIMVEENLVERSAEMGALLQKRLIDTFSNHPHVAEVRGRGLLQAIEIVRERDTLTPFDEADNVSNRIVANALKKGVFFYGGGTGEVRDIVCMGPAFIIEEQHIETMVEVLLESLNEVTG